MLCKNCVHFAVCVNVYCEVTAETEIKNIHGKPCYYFEDKSKYIELPCKVGDTVYSYCKVVDQIVGYSVEDVHIDKEQTRYFATAFDVYYKEYLDEIEFAEDEIGKTVFLAKSEAEQKLKELKENANS